MCSIHQRSIAILASALVAHQAHADGVTLPDDTLTGVRGLLTIEEFQFPGSVGYAPNVTGSSEFIAFAVSHSDPSSGPDTFTSGWLGANITRSQWDTDARVRLNDNSTINLTALGSFEALFGSADGLAAVYWRFDLSESSLNESTDHDDTSFVTGPIDFNFYRQDAIAHSEFIALGTDGQILDASLASAIPEPASALLLGLGSLALLRRRRNA